MAGAGLRATAAVAKREGYGLEGRARLIERILEGLTVLAAIATVPLTIVQEQGSGGRFASDLDWLIWSVFLVDYAAMFVLVGDKRHYVRSAWLNAAIVVLTFPLLPTLLAFLRLARLIRLVPLLQLAIVIPRGLRALRVALGRTGLVWIATATAFLILAGGGVLALIEPETFKGGFLDGLWWGVVTATTVGYGDYAPTTLWGRLVAVAVMVAGMGLFSTLAASLAAHFIGQEEGVDLNRLARRLDLQSAELAALGARLERIERLLTARAGVPPATGEGDPPPAEPPEAK